MRKLLLLGLVGLVLLLIGACAKAAPAPTPVVKEVIKEKEVVKEVPKEVTRLRYVVINRLAYAQFPLQEAFAKRIEERTNGRVKIELLSLPELGLTGFELLRVMKAGIVDGGENYVGYVAGDVPILDLLNIPGLFRDREANFKAIEAFKPFLRKFVEEKFDSVVISFNVYPENVVYSKKSLTRLDDFKGVKVRVHSLPLSQMWSALGGEAVTMAYAEVYTAIERGVLDGGITTFIHGPAAKWHEVTKYFAGPIRGVPYATNNISKKTWEKLPKDVQDIILEEAKVMEKQFYEWEAGISRDGVKINTDKGLVWQEFPPEITNTITGIARDKLVPAWAERAGPDGKKLFNDLIAPIVGYSTR